MVSKVTLNGETLMPTYTCAILSGYTHYTDDCYVRINDTSYKTAGEIAEYHEGDTITVFVIGNTPNIIINGVIVSQATSSWTSYVFNAPANSIDVGFSGGGAIINSCPSKVRYTARIFGNGNATNIYVQTSDGTKYYTNGSTFTFYAGDSITLYSFAGNQNGTSYVLINGESNSNGSGNPISVNYTLPPGDISISLSRDDEFFSMLNLLGGKKTYTLTIDEDSSGDIYNCYIYHNGTRYYSPTQFDFIEGDVLLLHARGSASNSGGGITNQWSQMISSSNSAVDYIYTLPSKNVSINLYYQSQSSNINIDTSPYIALLSNGEYDIEGFSRALVNLNAWKYETDTWSPSENILSPTIAFSGQYTAPPILVAMIDSSSSQSTTPSTVHCFVYINWYRANYARYMPPGESNWVYGAAYNYSTNATSQMINVSNKIITSTDTYVSNTGFNPRSVSTSYNYPWEGGRTYRWFAVWRVT